MRVVKKVTMMNTIDLVASLRSIYDAWQELLSRMSESEISQPRFADNWSVRDFVTHLWAWQQISVARFEAALAGSEPVYPEWLDGTDPFIAEEHTEKFNARIRAQNLERPWADVDQDWREGFSMLIHLAEQTPKDALFEEGRYSWLHGYPLAAVLSGSLSHHKEHLEEISAALA